jgi:hypothetical protein
MRASQRRENTAQRIKSWLEAIEEVAMFADGFDDAVMGLTYDANAGHWRVIYDSSECLSLLMQRDGMTFEEAVEFFDYNVTGGAVLPQSPLFMQ